MAAMITTWFGSSFRFSILLFGVLCNFYHISRLLPNETVATDDDDNNNNEEFKTNWTQYIQEFLQDSFDQSYGHHIPHFCPHNKSLKLCLLELFETSKHNESDGRSQFTKNRFNTTLFDVQEHGERLPWWYRTLLGDLANEDKKTGLSGPWHALTGVSPPYRQCSMEKIGTKHWKKVSCLANNRTNLKSGKCHQDSPVETLGADSKVPKFVFLRDPLERFLSAFLDKCLLRSYDPHCEPLSIYARGSRRIGLRNKHRGDRTYGPDTARRVFDAYVDTFPLRWNLHFFPQSFYCDGLFRTLPSYDFVGSMDGDFYTDLVALGQHFGPSMQKHLPIVFDELKKGKGGVANNNHDRNPNHNRNPKETSTLLTKQTSSLDNTAAKDEDTGRENVGVETKAAEKLQEFYTARTVKRVMELYSVDYLMLNLTVPQWALDILEQGEREDQERRRQRQQNRHPHNERAYSVLKASS